MYGKECLAAYAAAHLLAGALMALPGLAASLKRCVMFIVRDLYYWLLKTPRA